MHVVLPFFHISQLSLSLSFSFTLCVCLSLTLFSLSLSLTHAHTHTHTLSLSLCVCVNAVWKTCHLHIMYIPCVFIHPFSLNEPFSVLLSGDGHQAHHWRWPGNNGGCGSGLGGGQHLLGGEQPGSDWGGQAGRHQPHHAAGWQHAEPSRHRAGSQSGVCGWGGVLGCDPVVGVGYWVCSQNRVRGWCWVLGCDPRVGYVVRVRYWAVIPEWGMRLGIGL